MNIKDKLKSFLRYEQGWSALKDDIPFTETTINTALKFTEGAANVFPGVEGEVMVTFTTPDIEITVYPNGEIEAFVQTLTVDNVKQLLRTYQIQ